MVFNKQKEIPCKGRDAGKGTVQHCIKTYCNAEKEENSHSSCPCFSIHQSATVCVSVCSADSHIHVLLKHPSH